MIQLLIIKRRDLMATYSYTRVSTKLTQTTENQDKLIADAGFAIDKVFADVGVSGSTPAFERPAFKEMLSVLKENDQVVCIMIDRLGRTASDVLQTVEYFKEHKIKLRVLQLDMIDLTSSMGKLVLTMLAAVAEMERNLTIERVTAGLARTKAQGTILGRQMQHSPDKIKVILADLQAGVPRMDVAFRHQVSEKSVSTYKKQYACAEAFQRLEAKWEKLQKQISMKGSV
jgi:putative DNA-invertase from lambdoid prophage Rac